MQRVYVKPEMLKWACVRAGDTAGDLYAKIPELHDWIHGEKLPTLKQLEKFAKAARVSVGYLFLPAPPEEKLPIPDMRTIGGQHVSRPSPDLLDTIYSCQKRQDWYKEYIKANGGERLQFLGRATLATRPKVAAAEMQSVFEYGVIARAACANWEEALNLFVARVEAAGILVMVNGVVGNNTSRSLDPDEFRGFALADDFAPVVFVNGADTKAARVFTLAHELAHLWLGDSAVSNSALATHQQNKTEVWCNRVAAEFLVPLAELTQAASKQPLNELSQLAKQFRVSKLVILRRLLDASLIPKAQFEESYSFELNQFTRPPSEEGGGDFYRSLTGRVSRRFAETLISSTLEGGTLMRNACQLLGVSTDKTFREFGKRMGYTL